LIPDLQLVDIKENHCDARHFPVRAEQLKTFDKDPIIEGEGEYV